MTTDRISTSAPGTAQYIFDTAPLGAVILFSTETHRPPTHHTRKLRQWLDTNGAGRLVQKTLGTDPTNTSLKLRLYDANAPLVPADLYTRDFTVDSGLRFRIAAHPPPGSVKILRPVKRTLELLHLADDMASAEVWIEASHCRNLTLQIVPG